jgi:hypothetical protein
MTKPWKAVYIGSSDWDLEGPVTQKDWILAATAPELLEALDLLLICHDDQKSISFGQQKDEIHLQARAVIKKANGEAL